MFCLLDSEFHCSCYCLSWLHKPSKRKRLFPFCCESPKQFWCANGLFLRNRCWMPVKYFLMFSRLQPLDWCRYRSAEMTCYHASFPPSGIVSSRQPVKDCWPAVGEESVMIAEGWCLLKRQGNLAVPSNYHVPLRSRTDEWICHGNTGQGMIFV